MALIILAQITAVPGKEDALRAALNGLLAPTRAEAGCVVYDLHVDNTDPAFFMFYEIWESREAWLRHMESPHLKAHGSASEGMVAKVVLNEMTRLG
jgi:quinol monooxygenase YgiN